ncbi:MAG: hypothetical protein ACLFUJ_09910 [Phycisphaerae bacterium]
MIKKTAELIGGPVCFAVAATIGLIGYGFGIAGGYFLSELAEVTFGLHGVVAAATLGGLCSGVWPTFLRRRQRRYLLMAAMPLAAICAGVVVHLIHVPDLTGSWRLDAVFLGALIGGAAAMMVLMPVPTHRPQQA